MTSVWLLLDKSVETALTPRYQQGRLHKVGWLCFARVMCRIPSRRQRAEDSVTECTKVRVRSGGNGTRECDLQHQQ